jgi:hypothetical protein
MASEEFLKRFFTEVCSENFFVLSKNEVITKHETNRGLDELNLNSHSVNQLRSEEFGSFVLMRDTLVVFFY